MWNQWVFKGIKLCESKPFMTDIYGERQPRLVALVVSFTRTAEPQFLDSIRGAAAVPRCPLRSR